MFNLEKIEIPFSNNLAFDPYLSKLKYEDDAKHDYRIENLPESIRDNLFPFQMEGVEFGV